MSPYEGMSDADILYAYGIEVVLPLLAPDGIWVAPSDAPLDAPTIERELRRMAEHENYKPGQMVVFYSEDGKTVALLDRNVSVWDERLDLVEILKAQG